MKIERSGDLIYWTYHMMDWTKVKQVQSDQRCTECGRPMKDVEPVRDQRGRTYEGLVCHNCKRVLWVRRD